MSTQAAPDLAGGDLEVIGRIVGASNLAILVEVVGPGPRIRAVYKPELGERPLWDFPDGTLAARERAAHLVSSWGGWDVVPPTVLRDGPHGRGSVQEWIDVAEDVDGVVHLRTPGTVPAEEIEVLAGEDGDGRPVLLTHDDAPDLRSVAVLDAVLNNSDRKGTHLLVGPHGLRGIDHGLCLHHEPKLRTVLWGWAGQPLPPRDIERLELLLQVIEQDAPAGELDDLLTAAEVDALVARTRALLRAGRMPLPGTGWPAIPWPPL
ncbi:SCO1664 family protein [Janibacter sp. G1551]|uniref:SCO1664 family protein n=1 Tax=Janibacter sp. G1551 TaxID=3420440 RepID=UPI003CFFE2CD